MSQITPNRTSDDGRNYVIDFDLAELRQLTVHERTRPDDGSQVYPSRFSSESTVPFHLSTLNETLELLLGLNRATGREKHLLIEIKKPEYHAQNGKSISKIVIDTLNAYNLTRPTDPVIIQTFHIEELTYIRQTLGSQLRLYALITRNSVNESSSDYDFYQTEEGIRNLSQTVQALAPDYQLLVNYDANKAILSPKNFTRWAHQYNLRVYPYTFRKDSLFFAGNFEQLIDYFWHTVGVDGFITDHADVVLDVLQKTTATVATTAATHSSSSSLSAWQPLFLCAFAIVTMKHL